MSSLQKLIAATVVFAGLVLLSVPKGTVQAQVIGQTVTVTVTDGAGNPCPKIRVELWPNPPCILIPATRHRRAMCKEADHRFGFTDANGQIGFGATPPGNYIVCLCGGKCDAKNNCTFVCSGPSAGTAVLGPPNPAPAVALVLPKCKCP